MSAHLVISCDIPMEGGTCARSIAVSTTVLDVALRAAQRDGWQVTLGGRACCPDHRRR